MATRRTSTVLTALATVAAVTAQEQGDPSSKAAWREFVARHGDRWVVEWSAATGTPGVIWGEGLVVADGVGDEARARVLAQSLLDEHAGLLGRGASTFHATIAQRVGDVWVLVFEQRFRGLRVVGGRADVRLRASGVVAMFGARAVPIDAAFPTVPALSEGLARRLAHRLVRQKPHAGAFAAERAPELVIWADVDGAARAEPRLAWCVPVQVGGGDEIVAGDVYLDAHSGVVLEFVDRVVRCGFGSVHDVCAHSPGEVRSLESRASGHPMALTGNVRAWSYRGDPMGALVDMPLRGLRVSAAGVGSVWTDARGDFSIPHNGTSPVTVRLDFGPNSGRHLGGGVVAGAGTPVTASARATVGTPVRIRLLDPNASDLLWSQTTTFWHVDDAYEWLSVSTGPIPSNFVNLDDLRAVVNKSGSCLAWYQGNTIEFSLAGGACRNSAVPSIIYHEWGHAADDAFGGLSLNDGLSEGWADVIATYRRDDPGIGGDHLYSGTPVRTALNTRRYPAGGGRHQQGETWMGWAWDVRTNLIASLGRSAGIARAEAVVVGSIAADARTQPDAVREVFILDDDDGNLLNGTPHYAELVTACRKRNLPFPVADLGSISHVALQSTEDQLEPQLVRAIVQPRFGSFLRVELVHDAGNGPQRRDMVPAGGAGEFVALIPGQSAGATVEYRIEAAHSSGLTLAEPGSGWHPYAIGRERVLFQDDFETGATGWSHRAIRVADDWQLAMPGGAAGTASGTSWSDPPAAASGGFAFGNDMGPLDGSYEAGATNELLAPALDLTGVTGVTLSFKRWLTVEQAQFDRASLHVNGATVWTNPSTADLLDTSWSNFRLRVPQADGRPSVRFAWRLQSDSAVQYGGWNVDDFRVSSFAPAPQLAVRATVTPAQVPLGGAARLEILGPPNALAALLLSDDQGPIRLFGLELAVGPSFIALPLLLDANGRFHVTFGVSSSQAARGVPVFGQVVAASGQRIELSNKLVVLHGN